MNTLRTRGPRTGPGLARTVRNLPVWVKLTALVGASVVALGSCVGVMLVADAQSDAGAQRLKNVNQANAIVLQLDRNAVELKNAVLEAVLRDDPTQEKAVLERHRKTAEDLLGQLQRAKLTRDERASVDRIRTVFTDYNQVVDRFVEGAIADPKAARASWEQVGIDNYLTSAVTSTERQFFARAIDSAQAAAADSRAQATRSIGVTVAIALVILVLLAWFVVRSITQPLLRVRQALAAVATGDLTVTSGVDSTDEMGQMASALDSTLAGLRSTIAHVARSAEAMAASSTELDTVSGELTATARAAATQALEVATSAREMSGSATSITSATGEMISSISEISHQAVSASTVAAEAVQTVAETSQAVSALDVASQEIGEIIRTITSIAEQTNLLALNATIEAARAGEAGAGFAVVASEVKELARETATATEDIIEKITAIQETTGTAISRIDQISSVIRQINEKQATIAGAVEEQTSVTHQVSSSVAEISSGSARVASTIEEITQGTERTTGAATTTAGSAARLASLSKETHALLSHFRY